MHILFFLCIIIFFLGVLLIRKMDEPAEKSFGWAMVVAAVIGTLGNFCLLFANDGDNNPFEYLALHLGVFVSCFVLNRIYTAPTRNHPRILDAPLLARPEVFLVAGCLFIGLTAYLVYTLATKPLFGDKHWYEGFVPLLIFCGNDLLFVGRASATYPVGVRKHVRRFRRLYLTIRILFLASLITPILIGLAYIVAIVYGAIAVVIFGSRQP